MDYMLRKGEVLAMAASGAAGEFKVLQGSIWLTRAGDQQDYLLSAGKRFQLGAKGTYVLEALADATLALEGVAASDVRTTVRIELALSRTSLAEVW